MRRCEQENVGNNKQEDISDNEWEDHRFKDGVLVKYHIPDICMIWYTMWPDMPMICNTDVSLMFGRNSYSSAKYHYNKYH